MAQRPLSLAPQGAASMTVLRASYSGLVKGSARTIRTSKAFNNTTLIRQPFSASAFMRMDAQRSVRIIEVGPRDGLQNIAKLVPTATKIELIERLRAAGLHSIEMTSAVSPKAIPQLADNQTLLSNSAIRTLLDETSLRLPVLVPNIRGLELALINGVKEVAVFVSASEGFSKANTNCTVEEGLRRASEVAVIALKAGV
jgi:hydroxymethylglutaryl-CoA lyase